MIYANGCSFTFGDELDDPRSAYPHRLADRLGTTAVNDAMSGGTNYRSVYQTIKNTENNFELYVIAWTSTARYTHYKSDNNHEINFNPQLVNALYGKEDFYNKWGQTLYKHWHNELYAFKLWLQQIIQLQAMFEHTKKKYLMINTMPNNLAEWSMPKNQFISSVKNLINFDIMTDDQILAEYDEIQYYTKLINVDNFYKWNEFCITDLRTQFPCGPQGHLLNDGHQHLSDLLYHHICSK